MNRHKLLILNIAIVFSLMGAFIGGIWGLFIGGGLVYFEIISSPYWVAYGFAILGFLSVFTKTFTNK